MPPREPPRPDLPLFPEALADREAASGAAPARRPAWGPPAPRRPEPEVMSVAELDRRLKRLVETGTQKVWVGGEVSGLRVVSSGHAYFTLKDEREEATLDCVMYRTAPPRSHRLLADGARVVLVGRATVYVPRGRLQFVAEEARPAGRGALLEALERLKEKLAAEGLFARERKRPLPAEARTIGVVTSGDGAAIHDIVKVAWRRGGARILLARARVQGAGAAQGIARAIAMLARVPEVDAIIVGRGGGSADDLAAFNDEMVVRQVAACRVPVVSAVGHEIDVTLTDLAADARAATPSQAAELLVPDAAANRAKLDHLRAHMRRALALRIVSARAELERLRGALGSPRPLLGERQQRLDEAVGRMSMAAVRLFGTRRTAVQRLARRLEARHPRAVLEASRARLGPLDVRLTAAMKRRLSASRGGVAPLEVRLAAAMKRRSSVLRSGVAPLEARLVAAEKERLAALRRTLAGSAARLDAMSPLAVLARGYAIALDDRGRAVRDASDLSEGDRVTVLVARGRFTARVLATSLDDEAAARDRDAAASAAPAAEAAPTAPVGPTAPAVPAPRAADAAAGSSGPV